MGRLIVWLLIELLVMFPPETVPAPAVNPLLNRTLLPDKLKAAAPLLKVIPLKRLPVTKLLLFGLGRSRPPKNRASFAIGAVSRSQLAPVSQLLSVPPPSQVRLA